MKVLRCERSVCRCEKYHIDEKLPKRIKEMVVIRIELVGRIFKKP